MHRRSLAAAAFFAVASLIVAPSLAAPSEAGIRPCTHGYTYAGLASPTGVDGVTASITATSLPSVATGHVAAWVGVGGLHVGPGAANEWLQAGIAAFRGTGLRLYVEEVSLHRQRRFVDLGPATLGRSYRVRVVETGADLWRASVDGKRVGMAAYLPTTGGSWRAVATAESWAAGHSTCNRYGYRFEHVSLLSPTHWAGLADAERVGAQVARHNTGFSAEY